MCQQWFTVAGLIFDAAGFLLIAFEWRHVFQREHEMRIDELEHDSERHGAKLRGEKYEDPRRGDYTVWREFQRLFLKEWRLGKNCFTPVLRWWLLDFWDKYLEAGRII